MQPISYAGRFPPEVIRHAVWLYLRFTLSYRDVEELLAERGLELSYNETCARRGGLARCTAVLSCSGLRSGAPHGRPSLRRGG